MADDTKNPLQRLQAFVRDVWDEMKKVNWTSRTQLKQATKVVLVSMILMAIFLGSVDVLSSAVLAWFLELKF
jgi:preprotein translocase subunit SecE